MTKKSNFLLVDLNEPQTKKLAETITSETSRKVLNYLTEKDETEANLAKELNLPISTVHYHLQKLLEAGLVIVEEFHYSQKGREINHYRLANKYIIIAPTKISGLKEKLRGILPIALIALGISALLKIFTSTSQKMFAASAGITEKQMLTVPVKEAVSDLAYALPSKPAPTPDIAFWFFLGCLVTLGIYVLVVLVKELLERRKNK
ncbi:MAG TPA: helix-turn-helix domain-containing protein [Candidatus Nanoarchaeia archaeon]|nr:helix-turn-helix domain-containing protein [Candidatus Nanoarchaeia archaeon]